MYWRNSSQESLDSESSSSTIKLAPCASRSATSSEDEDSRVPLLRKKSGQLVKSSLKLSSLGRCSSSPQLSQSQSQSSQLMKSKSVRFAPRLANIKMFNGRDSPSVVSTDNTPLGSPHYFDPSSYFTNKPLTDSFPDFNQDSWDTPFNVSGWDHSSDTWDFARDTHSLDASSLDSWDESDDDDDAYALVSSDVVPTPPGVVSLQSIAVHNSSLVGTVAVANLAFEKKIAIKLTFNRWLSTIIINNAHYARSSGAHDYFHFSVSLSQQRAHNINVELVVKYDVANQTHWDNNSGKNYHLALSKTVSTTVSQNQPAHTPQYDELVSRLMSVQNRSQYTHSSSSTPASSTSSSSTSSTSDLRRRYNFHELDEPRTSLPTRPKYSQSFRLKHASVPNNNNTNIKNTTNTTNAQDSINSKSYADLLQSYCFFNPSSSAPPPRLDAARDSPASTFHLLSDSIHT